MSQKELASGPAIGTGLDFRRIDQLIRGTAVRQPAFNLFFENPDPDGTDVEEGGQHVDFSGDQPRLTQNPQVMGDQVMWRFEYISQLTVALHNFRQRMNYR